MQQNGDWGGVCVGGVAGCVVVPSMLSLLPLRPVPWPAPCPPTAELTRRPDDAPLSYSVGSAAGWAQADQTRRALHGNARETTTPARPLPRPQLVHLIRRHFDRQHADAACVRLQVKVHRSSLATRARRRPLRAGSGGGRSGAGSTARARRATAVQLKHTAAQTRWPLRKPRSGPTMGSPPQEAWLPARRCALDLGGELS